MNFLAFDLGGGSGKLTLGTYENGELTFTKIHQFANTIISEGESLYWDIPRALRELETGVKKAVSLTADKIDGIGFDSFCNDFAIIRYAGADDAPLCAAGSAAEQILCKLSAAPDLASPVHSYRDARTIRTQQGFDKVMSPRERYMINGNQNAPFNTLNHLYAMSIESPEDFGEDRFIFVSDYFIYAITGKEVLEYTTASVTQMYDYTAERWSEEILTSYGISEKMFPPITAPGTLIGLTDAAFNERVGSARGIPVYTVCQHDTASAFLGSIGGPDTAIISTGTWCLVGCEANAPVISEYGFARNIANEGGYGGPYGGHHRILKNVMGTWILQEIVREANEAESESATAAPCAKLEPGTALTFENLEAQAQEFAAQAQEPAESATPLTIDVDEPQFYEPGDMLRKVVAAYKKRYGKAPKSLGQVAYIIYASLAEKYAQAIDELETLTGKKFTQINMIGGGIKSRIMRELTEQASGRRVILGPEDATSIGNILVQMHAAGAISSIDEGRRLVSHI